MASASVVLQNNLLNKHIKIYDGTSINHIWKGGEYEPKMSIQKRLEAFGIDTSNHTFLFPYLAVYTETHWWYTEAFLTAATTE